MLPVSGMGSVLPPSWPDHWLAVRFSSLGDVVLTTGVLRWLHERHGWSFTVLTKPAWAPLFGGHPAVRAVLAPDEEHLRGAAYRTFARKLANSDLEPGTGLLDLHGSLRSRLLARYWKGPKRRVAGFRVQRRLFLWSGGRFFRKELREYNVPQRYILAVEENAPPRKDLLPVVHLSPAEREESRALLAGAGIAGERPFIALHPYAAHALKAWPREYWRELATGLEAHGVDWCALGQGDPFLGTGKDLTGKTSLRQSCAILSQARALITGESGPMHLASAVGAPVVALFGPTGPEWGFYPEGTRDVVLETGLPCRPCSLHGKASCKNDGRCMREIRPEAVLKAALHLCAPPGKISERTEPSA